MSWVLLAYSLGDPAGKGAADAIRELKGSGSPCSIKGAVDCNSYREMRAYLAGFREDNIYFEFLDEAAPDNVAAYIILSRHSGGKPSLTLHYPGNPGSKAPYGGRPRELAIAWPRLMAALARTYHDTAAGKGLLQRYTFTLEATHHGPTSLRKPIVFIEIGSSPSEWRDPEAWTAMAEAVVEVLEHGWSREQCSGIVVGVGDTHYPVKHTRALLEEELCYSHIFSRHVLPELTPSIVKQAVEKTIETVDAIVHTKIPGSTRRMLADTARELGLKLEKL
ncbi:MAG: D-tyrosyl-tRNA(Tyr) deacylase [Hyperthermus sp.]|nr:MAG: D-tyrosyl-tRNA(Tyr) deacylase [Hyperthermus sp.]